MPACLPVVTKLERLGANCVHAKRLLALVEELQAMHVGHRKLVLADLDNLRVERLNSANLNMTIARRERRLFSPQADRRLPRSCVTTV